MANFELGQTGMGLPKDTDMLWGQAGNPTDLDLDGLQVRAVGCRGAVLSLAGRPS